MALCCGNSSKEPSLRGVVADLPHVAEGAQRRLERRAWQTAARCRGKFFESAPVGDTYVLKFIIHDWMTSSRWQYSGTAGVRWLRTAGYFCGRGNPARYGHILHEVRGSEHAVMTGGASGPRRIPRFARFGGSALNTDHPTCTEMSILEPFRLEASRERLSRVPILRNPRGGAMEETKPWIPGVNCLRVGDRTEAIGAISGLPVPEFDAP